MPDPRMPWSRPALVVRCILLLMCSEFVRTGLLVPYLSLKGGQLGLSATGVGLLFSAHYLADAAAKGPIGVLGERVGLGRVLLLGALLGAGMLWLLHHTASLPLLVLASALWGLCYAALWPGVMAAAQHFARPGMTARALAITSVASVPPIVLGLLGVGQLMGRAAPLGLPMLAGVQLAALLLALSVTGLSLPRSEQLSPAPARRPFRERWGRVAALLPAALAQTAAPALLATVFYPLLARTGVHLAQLLLPVLLGVAVGLTTLWAASRLADRTHPRRALTPGLLLLALTFFVAGLPGLAGHLPLVTVLGGLGYGGFIAGWNGLIGRTLPAEYRAAAWGTIMAVESAGTALGPLLGAFMWSRYGQAGVFWSGAGIFLAVQGYYLWGARK